MTDDSHKLSTLFSWNRSVIFGLLVNGWRQMVWPSWHFVRKQEMMREKLYIDNVEYLGYWFIYSNVFR